LQLKKQRTIYNWRKNILSHYLCISLSSYFFVIFVTQMNDHVTPSLLVTFFLYVVYSPQNIFLHIDTLKINMSYIFQKSTLAQRKEQPFLLSYLLTEFNKPTNLLFLSRFIYMSKHLDDNIVKLKNKSFRSIISIR
jgi:hypothetical protein